MRLYSSAPARAIAEDGRLDEESFKARPAGARRQGLVASVAFPREEVLTQRSRIPGFLLCDSVRIALAHEAAHLWIFASLTGEERIPESIHEGLAEWVADRVQCQYERVTGIYGLPFRLPDTSFPNEARFCVFPLEVRRTVPNWIGRASTAFDRDAVAFLDSASERGHWPEFRKLLSTSPRDSGSPRLWTSVAWAYVGGMLSRGDNPYSFVTWLRAMADGGDPLETYGQVFGDADWTAWLDSTRGQVKRWPTTRIVGEDVSPLGWSPFGEDFLLAPSTGRQAAWLGRKSGNDRDLDIALTVECLGGGAPEIWIGFGLDDELSGVRLVLTQGGVASLEELKSGIPQFGPTTPIPSAFFPSTRAVDLRIEKRSDRVVVKSGLRRFELQLREGVKFSAGRTGVGARGGAFVVRGLRARPAGDSHASLR
jgi:hypothetical protein